MSVLPYEDGTAPHPVYRVSWLRPVVADAPTPARVLLKAQAERLWPESEPHGLRNRAEWLRAVAVVRATTNGWRWERDTPRLDRPL